MVFETLTDLVQTMGAFFIEYPALALPLIAYSVFIVLGGLLR